MLLRRMRQQDALLKVLLAARRGMSLAELMEVLGTKHRSTKAALQRLRDRREITYIWRHRHWVYGDVEQLDTKDSTLEAVREAGPGGIRTADLADKLGLTLKGASSRLWRLRASDDIVKMGSTGASVRWAIKGMTFVAPTPKPKKPRKRWSERPLSYDAWAEETPTHRVVDAAQAQKPTATINSVWALAA